MLSQDVGAVIVGPFFKEFSVLERDHEHQGKANFFVRGREAEKRSGVDPLIDQIAGHLVAFREHVVDAHGKARAGVHMVLFLPDELISRKRMVYLGVETEIWVAQLLQRIIVVLFDELVELF